MPFDAETYLRISGERQLADGEQNRHRHPPLQPPAAALVVAGVIDRRTAQRGIDDHTAALRVRNGERGIHHFAAGRGRPRPGHLAPRQTMLIEQELAFAGGRLFLRDLALAADQSFGACDRRRCRGVRPGAWRR